MNDIEISVEHNEYRLAGTLAFLDSGPANARIDFYDGIRPSFGAAPAGTLLGSLTLAKPAGVVADGVFALAQDEDGLVVASGGATWARVVNGDDLIAFDCDVSDESGTATIRLPSTTLFEGGLIRMTTGILG